MSCPKKSEEFSSRDILKKHVQKFAIVMCPHPVESVVDEEREGETRPINQR